MDLRESAEDQAFRAEVRDWLAANLVGEYAEALGTGGPGREHEDLEVRGSWERTVGQAGWIGVGWPTEYGGRGLSLWQQVIFHEEYARSGAPARLGHIGEQLLGPTLVAFGTDEQRRRFLPGILAGEELWCQGYSEPDAGSDLAAVQTSAVLRDGKWHITGQKVWTSLAQFSDWCFVLARTDPAAPKHKGLSYLLVPMRQPGIEVRPIVQLTGTSEFNEVFFDDAVTDADNVVGAPGDGWKVALGTLAFERGVATLGQQIGFERELQSVIDLARANGAMSDPALADRIVTAWMELRVMRYTALRTLGITTSAGAGGSLSGAEASISKLMWANWHRRLGEIAMDVVGPDATLADGAPYELSDIQRLFLFTRSDTIYGGSNEIQRNIIAERMLGLPRDRR